MTPSVAPATPALLGKTTVAVRLNDAMTITLSQAAVPEGTVTFNVKNAGSVTHDLIVLKTSLLQNQIPTDPSQPARAQEPGFLGQIANLAPGAETTLTLQLPAGSYVLMCNQPAHYIAGMHAAFAVNGVAAAIDPVK